MAKREIITCDNCGVEKKATNHWFVIAVIENQFSLHKWEEISGWNHVCGEKCVLEMAGRWMSSGKLIAEKTDMGREK